jgi:hypothetical protein
MNDSPEFNPEYVQCGTDLAPLNPTMHLKVDPWGHLWQWHVAVAQDIHGSVSTVGKWIKVRQE